MAKVLSDLAPNPARSLLPPLSVMEGRGYDRDECLAGVGIAYDDLLVPGARISLDQEMRFYRNVLDLTGDAAIGLKLGEPFLPENYGLFGYALLSAETLRHALNIAENFGRLTFSIFKFRFGVERGLAFFSLEYPPALEPALLRLYADRDLSAARIDIAAILGAPLPLASVSLAHDGKPDRRVYRAHFDCPIAFCTPVARLCFPAALLDKPLPQSDPQSSRHLQQQCQLLLAKLTAGGSFVDEVRMLILARPRFFPDINDIAERLDMSARTLRRRLGEEGSSFRQILDEVRYGLAQEYLMNTDLPMDEISRLLGYSESGNFSHAFRRWTGLSPTQWRQHHSAQP